MADLTYAAAARSWLFAPGDSARKMEKAAGGDADIVLLDLEDAVAPEAKPEARAQVAGFLDAADAAGHDRARLWVRVNPLDGPHTLIDLATVMPHRPGGLMLPKAQGRADLDRFGHWLDMAEQQAGIAPGTTPVIVLATETARGMFACDAYAGHPRLAALSWGAEDLADALGADGNTEADGSYSFTYELARSLCLLGAAAAGVPAVETIAGDFRDLDGLRLRAERMRRQGFSGMLAIHPAQVPVINAAFTPDAGAVARAQAIIDLFAANPGAGTIGHDGAMLDRPHLARAQRLVARADRGSGRAGG